MPAARRWRVAGLALIFTLTTLYYISQQPRGEWSYGHGNYIPAAPKSPKNDGKVHWSKLEDRYPVTSLIAYPTGAPKKISAIQAQQPKEDAAYKAQRLFRKNAVLESFNHSWAGYKDHAWLRDEVAPVSGAYKDTFGGWAATLVDSLDTLWIMGMKADFEMAVRAVEEIDFTTTEEKDINVFETTIRYLGGFLAAYDISGGKYPVLLNKAVEVGELLMACFDTPNRMPITRWDWKEYVSGKPQEAPGRSLVSEPGSLSLEFTRLYQLTKEPKYYDAVQRISDAFETSQNDTKLPGMWPVSVDMSQLLFNDDNFFTLGGMSDSLYEYFPKQYLLMGGVLEQPKKLYEGFIEVAKKYMFFRIFNPQNEKLLVSGDLRAHLPSDPPQLVPRNQHLTCFTGGMVALASKAFDRPDDLETAAELAAGCVWAYDSGPNGIAPEIFTVMPCPKDTHGAGADDCKWSENAWHRALAEKHTNKNSGTESDSQMVDRVLALAEEARLPPGFTQIDDRRYILRPEAIESVWIMWRITADPKWQAAAWRMFQAVEKVSRTDIAASAVWDITQDPAKIKESQMDSMESFWLAETLKYFYLCFEDFDVVSLDEYVLNTEAHPMKRPAGSTSRLV